MGVVIHESLPLLSLSNGEGVNNLVDKKRFN